MAEKERLNLSYRSTYDRVDRTPVQCAIQTEKQLIIGYIHVNPLIRTKDTLDNLQKDYLAITDARIAGAPADTPAMKVIFINRNHIVWIAPKDDQDLAADF